MTHLSPSELVDFAENTLDVRRAAHVETCETCRVQAASVREFVGMSREAASVPEPSPLFWDHLAGRVRDAIAADAPPAGRLFGFRGMRAMIPAAAVVVTIVSVAMWTREVGERTVPDGFVAGAAHLAGDATPERDAAPDAAHDEVWAVLTAAADDLQLDEARAAGMAVQPATVDGAVQALSAAELSELGRLLQSELKRSND